MKTYSTTDAEGTWLVVEQDNGVVVRQLQEPSTAFLDERIANVADSVSTRTTASVENLIAQASSFDDLKKLLAQQLQ